MNKKKRIKVNLVSECAHCKEDPRIGEFPRPVVGYLMLTPLCNYHLKNAVIFDNRLLGVFEAYAHKQAIQVLKNHGIGTAV